MLFEKNKCKEYEPYPHQAEIADVLDKMEAEYGNFSTIVNVPTGGGKTKIAIDFCRKALYTDKKNSDCNNKVLWLTDSIDLLTQSIDRFRCVPIERPVSYQLICGTAVSYDEKNKKWGRGCGNVISQKLSDINCDTDIIFASVETIRTYIAETNIELSRWIEQSQNNGKLYIIYDEVHHIGADKTEPFLREITRKASKRVLIGLTATVYRYDSPINSFNRWFKCGWDNKKQILVKNNSALGDSVDGFINNRINVASIQRLIDEKRLIKPKIIRVDDYKDGMPEPLKLDDKISHGNEMKYLARKIAGTYKKEGEEWNKTIIFVDDIKSAKSLKDELDSLGVESFTYISGDEQYSDEDLKKFKDEKSTDCKLMIAVDMATEGFDVKNIQTIYLYSKILSQIVLRQRVGRVLRTADNKKSATIYWQKFYKGKPYKKYDEIVFADKEETDVEIQRDIGRWKKGMQLPAGMYLEPLPVDDVEERLIYKRYEFLRILDKFGLELAVDGIDYYDCGEQKVYARKIEQKGYEQFWYLIKADYYSCLIRQMEYEHFGDYVNALGVSEDDLLKSIKVNCFYRSNVTNADVKGKVDGKERFIVTNKDIKCFYEYVISHDLKMPTLISTVSGDIVVENDLDDNSEDEEKSELNETERILFEEAIVEQQMKAEGIGKQDNLLDAIKLQQGLEARYLNSHEKKQKKYTDLLNYGSNGKNIYEKLLSLQAIISNGATDVPRECGILKGVSGELAFIGKDKDENYKEIKALPRVVNKLLPDNLLFAQALITVPNQISVSPSDVSEYEELLWNALVGSNIKIAGKNAKEKVAKEFIMALGYQANQDDIIRMQCELFGKKIPRLLQYVIYCRCYCELAEKINFIGEDGVLSTHPSNDMVDGLRKEYKEILLSYGIAELDNDLTPVEDVIFDYRPYIKAVPYYQGIKPEFLCRMLNDMLVLADKSQTKFCDAFGGSGTISLNMNEQLELTQTYNDLGIFNKSFFDTLKDSAKRKKLKSMVENFIHLVFDNTGNDQKTQEFLKPYVDILQERKAYLCNCMEEKGDISDKIVVEGEEITLGDVLQQTEAIKELINKLQKSINEKHLIYSLKYDKQSERNKKLSLEDRLKKQREPYYKILRHVYDDIDDNFIGQVEKHFHSVMLDLLKFFYAMAKVKDDRLVNKWSVELGFAFFTLNFFNRQHFFNHTTISRIAYYVGNYEKYINMSSEVFASIKIYRKDAIGLIPKLSDIEVWYQDIPYSESDSRTYCQAWFNEVEFVNNLSVCNGDYIIASRYNTCEDLSEKHLYDRRTLKQYGIVKFFSRFVDEDVYKKYIDIVKKEYRNVEDFKSADTDYNNWNCIGTRKSAKYICFAYTKSGEQNGEHYSSVSSLSEDTIRRMLANTQFSKIPVEIMLTNMDMKLEENRRVHKLSDGLWCMPTFVTYSSYQVEPITIIMDYKMFYEKMILTLLSNAYETENHKDFAAAYRNLFEQKNNG